MNSSVLKITSVTIITGFLYFIFPWNELGKYIKESMENKIGKSGYIGYIGKVGYISKTSNETLRLINLWLSKPEFIIENIELIESECDFGCDLC